MTNIFCITENCNGTRQIRAKTNRTVMLCEVCLKKHINKMRRTNRRQKQYIPETAEKREHRKLCAKHRTNNKTAEYKDADRKQRNVKQNLKRSCPVEKHKLKIKRDCKRADPVYISKMQAKQSTAEYKARRNKQYKEVHSKNTSYKEKEKLRTSTLQYKANRKQRHQDRYNNDPLYKLKHQIRCLVSRSLEKHNHKKSSKTYEILGCSYKELQNHLNMTCIENYGIELEELRVVGVHIDHIMPLVTATAKDDLLRLNHFSNLQILTAADNLRKSSKLNFKI